MRILVLSNLYPPHYLGGYEIACKDVVDELEKRGHVLRVITSIYGINQENDDGKVYRLYRMSRNTIVSNILKTIQYKYSFKNKVNNAIWLFDPDIIYCWNIEGLPLDVIRFAEKNKIPVCHFIGCDWFLEEKNRTPYYKNLKIQNLWSCVRKDYFQELNVFSEKKYSSIKRIKNVQFASHYLRSVFRQNGLNALCEEVIPHGIDMNLFTLKNEISNANRLLCVASHYPLKGVHTAIKALNILVNKHGCRYLKMTIVGPIASSHYYEYLKKLTVRYHLSDRIDFMGFISREDLAHLYKKHDILVSPSIIKEGFGLVAIEAMATGLAVVGTATGGGAEIMINEQNSLIFPNRNARLCAAQIFRLLNDHDLYERIIKNGSQTVKDKFKLSDMVSKIETMLLNVIKNN